MPSVDSGEQTEPDHAHVAVLPPLLYFVALVSGVLAKLLVGGGLPLPSGLRWLLGAAFAAVGTGCIVAFTRAFREAGQDRNPNTPTPAVLSEGIYRFSRNPAYLGLTALQLGFGLLLDNAWILLFLLPVVVTLHYGVILREEAYLERTFGDEYRSYKASVRRWL